MPDAAVVPLSQVDPHQAWEPWQPDAANPWGMKWAGHLYRRAGFGPTLFELREAVKEGYAAALDRLLNVGERESFLDSAGEQTARNRTNAYDLRGWWLDTMLTTSYPLGEKMTLFWHNHFATSILKVGRPLLMFSQNRLMRQFALGKFRPFLLAMSQDPAMLIWLDSNSNVKGKPNENYAREVMELFSLGVGNYTETDVREAARAFTGWHTDDDRFAFNAKLHDDGDKKVLGVTGKLNGDDVIRIVLEQPAAARFLVGKLYASFVSETPPPKGFLDPLCDFYRKSDYATGELVRRMLRSRHFFSDHAYRQRIKSPVEFALGAARGLTTGRLQPASLIGRLDSMGQSIFAPPNVKGWAGGATWLNSATVLARHNFAQVVASGQLRLSDFEQRIASASSALEARIIEEGEREARERAKKEAGTRWPNLPDSSTDPAELVHYEKLSAPAKIADFLVELLLQGDVKSAARTKLAVFLKEGSPAGTRLDERIREAVHALMSMPEYQLA